MDKEAIENQFPQKVDLGREVPDYGPCCPSPEPAKKTRIDYPKLYLRDVAGLGIPKKNGMAVIYYKRCSFSEDENGDGDPVICVTLDVKKICFPAEGSQGEAVDQLSKEIQDALDAQGGSRDDDDGED